MCPRQQLGVVRGGGDGVDFVSLLDGNYNWGSLKPIQRATVSQLEEVAEIVPAAEWVPALQTVTLAAGAFAVGWEIGSTIDTKWLNLEGDGLGTTAGAPASITNVRWHYRPNGLAVNDSAGNPTGGNSGPGRYLEANCGGNWQVAYESGFAGESSCQAAARQYLSANDSSGVAVGLGAYNPYHPDVSVVAIKLTESAYGKAFSVGPIEPYTGQTSGIHTGWANPGSGAGVTTTADPFPGALTDPIPQQPAVQAVVDGLSDPARNDLNCRIDPADYACPTTNGDGTQYTSNGGRVVEVPQCYGMTVADCETAVEAGGGTVSFTVADSASPDPDVADGLVVATSPSTRALTEPTTVEISTNPDNDNPQECVSRTDYPHWSQEGGTVVAKGWLKCNYTGPAGGSMFLWKCTSEPESDAALLDLGEWGCSRVATTVNQPVAAIAGVFSGPIYVPPEGAPAVAQTPSYYLATTTAGSMGPPVWQTWTPTDYGYSAATGWGTL